MAIKTIEEISEEFKNKLLDSQEPFKEDEEDYVWVNLEMMNGQNFKYKVKKSDIIAK